MGLLLDTNVIDARAELSPLGDAGPPLLRPEIAAKTVAGRDNRHGNTEPSSTIRIGARRRNAG